MLLYKNTILHYASSLFRLLKIKQMFDSRQTLLGNDHHGNCQIING